MKRKNLKPRVFFNASVILSGLYSPSGGSGKLLTFLKQKRITGLISEIIQNEVLRHAEELALGKTVETLIPVLFFPIYPAPGLELVKSYSLVIVDQGDAHVLASSHEAHADFLVTLDKKHLLILQNKVKGVKIVSPKELLEWLKKANNP